MVADKGKKSKVAEPGAQGAEPEQHIDGELVLSIEKLQEIQDELERVTLSFAKGKGRKKRFFLFFFIPFHSNHFSFLDFPKRNVVNEEASDKVFEVEQKYNEIRRPVYVRRAEIIQHIPDFWLTAIFKFLHSLDVEDFKDVKTGYSITFNFSKNPYFEDTKLTKTYSFNDEGTTNVTGTTIKWKDGMEHIANGDAHEKKGNKRPFAEERLILSLTIFSAEHLSINICCIIE
ncbi:hypothetical protein BHE74_00052883 [Ensete ventricosum]|nr:hypothetical protein GW17_00021715 [Ensete ventricosum]RWW41621.1 hypothetical protein BHE74_00052883 [Ensete ventricosum]RZS20215.1 hypothetical protein BHM03_00052730 [Ensete ventricosum]